MKRRQVVRNLLLGIAAAGGVRAAASEPNLNMTAAQFAAWTASRRQSLEQSRQSPSSLEQALTQRLKADRWVTDSAVMDVVDAWSLYESPSLGNAAGSVSPRFPQTHRVINALLPYLRTRAALQAELYRKSASLYRTEISNAAAAKEYQKALDLLTPLGLEIDRARLDSLVEEAAALTHVGDDRSANALYLKALQYPFYLASDPEMEKDLRDLYIRAGRGIIDLRRHNLPLLKELVFVPSTDADLQPYLQAAIKEASGP